jgi:anti-sigma regulatory factor (Ser/Thr protein kinase)
MARDRDHQTYPDVVAASRAMRVHADIPADSHAPAEARRVLGPVAALLSREVAGALAIVASELVTNSIRHSGAGPGTPIELDASVDHGRVRLSVHDPGDGFDGGAHAPEPGAVGGWGLQVVEGLVDRWWVEVDSGTRVVCEIAG